MSKTQFMTQKNTLASLLQRTKDYVSTKPFKVIVFSTLFFWLVANLFMATNVSFSHDGLILYIDDSKAAYVVARGRFSQPLYWFFRGALNVPWLCSTLSLIWLILSILLIQSFLRLRSSLSLFLLCGILTVNVTNTLINATYTPWIDLYSFALFLALLGYWVCEKYRIKGAIVGSLLFCFSLGLYQAYLAVLLPLFLIVVIKALLEQTQTVKQIIFRTLRFALFIILSLVLYLTFVQLSMAWYGIEAANSYNGISNLGDYSNTSIITLVGKAWLYPFQFLWSGIGAIHPSLMLTIKALLFVFAFALLIFLIKRQRLTLPEVLTVFICLFLMPLATNAVYVISKGMIHELMVYGLQFFYVLAIAIVDTWYAKSNCQNCNLTQGIRLAFAALVSVVIFNNIVFANQVYLEKKLEYDTTLSVVTRVVDRIEQVDGYEPGKTPIAFIGKFSDSPLFAQRDGFEHLKGVGLASSSSITYTNGSVDGGTIYLYFTSVLGYPLNMVSMNEARSISQSNQVKEMPIFPQNGSVQLIDGMVVVKIAQPETN